MTMTPTGYGMTIFDCALDEDLHPAQLAFSSSPPPYLYSLDCSKFMTRRMYMYFSLDVSSLLFTKSRLEEEVYGVEEALHTCKHMLTYWKECFEATLER